MNKYIVYLLVFAVTPLYSNVTYLHIDNRSSTDFFVPTYNTTVPATSQQRLYLDQAEPLPALIGLQSTSHTFDIRLQSPTRRSLLPCAIPAPTSCSLAMCAAFIKQKEYVEFSLDFDSALAVSKRVPQGDVLLIIFDDNDPYAHANTLHCGPYKLHGYIIKEKISHNFLLTE